MRLALVLGGLSAALPLPFSAFFSPSSCAFSCPVTKESCNARRASAITNPPPNDRFMRCVIYESKDFDQRQPDLQPDQANAGKSQKFSRTSMSLPTRHRSHFVPLQ